MTTIEVTLPIPFTTKLLKHEISIRMDATFETLDSRTVNVSVDDKDCDMLTDYLDLKGYEHRLV